MTTLAETTAPSPAAPDGHARIAVVVVSYGAPGLLRRNLAACNLTGVAEVVVVDNWSSAENRQAVESLAASEGWHLVAMPDNRGFGAACNAGTAAARGLGCRTFLFLNPDAVISPSVVAELHAHSRREPLALISPVLVDSAGAVVFRAARTDLRTGWIRRRPAEAGSRTTDPGDWLCGACVTVHDELLSRIGGFDEGYFLYWEDVDLGYRAVAAGGAVILREDLVAVHDEGGTHGDSPRRTGQSALYYRYNCRNRLLFAARHLDRRRLLRWLLMTPAASWDILLRGGRRQLLASPALLWAATAGSLAGAAHALEALVRGSLPGPVRPGVLVVHAGAELYGSDRVLLDSVIALRGSAEVTVALPCAGPLVEELERRGVRVVVCRMPVLRKGVLRPLGLLGLVRDAVLGVRPALRLLRRSGRLLYVNTTVLPWWLVLGRWTGRRVVCHVHEAEWPGPRTLQRMLLLPLRAADTVVANSRFTEQALVRLAPSLAGSTTVVANPVPGPVTPAPAREALSGPLQLLFLGRLSPRKGPDIAIATLRELLRRGVDVRLTVLGSAFAGYEWFEDRLRAAGSGPELADRVAFLGFRRDIWPVLRAADVVLLPSRLDESFGNAAVESVLAARPAVVSDLQGLREAVAGYGSVQVAPAGRPDLWADAVQRVVGEWPRFRDAALADAARARRRHAVGAYRDRVAAVAFGAPTASPADAPRRAVVAP